MEMEKRPWASVTLTGLDDTPTLTPTLGTTTTGGGGGGVVVGPLGAVVGEMMLQRRAEEQVSIRRWGDALRV